jgi:hypothetical protein
VCTVSDAQPRSNFHHHQRWECIRRAEILKAYHDLQTQGASPSVRLPKSLKCPAPRCKCGARGRVGLMPVPSSMPPFGQLLTQQAMADMIAYLRELNGRP